MTYYSKKRLIRSSRSMPIMIPASSSSLSASASNTMTTTTTSSSDESDDDMEEQVSQNSSPLTSSSLVSSNKDSPIRRYNNNTYVGGGTAAAAARNKGPQVVLGLYNYRKQQQEPRKKIFPVRRRQRFVFVISLFASFWAIFMCIILWQFHIGNISPTVDPMVAFFSMVDTDEGRQRQHRLHFPSSSSSSLTMTRIPLPLPSQKVSVLLINYSRPRMVRDSSLMRTLLAHDNIDEVLLLHANPKTAFEFVHPKVMNIDATRHNDEMGLSLRFYFCQLAKNDWIVHVDDDMEFPTSTLNELFIEYSRNPRRIVGRFGRDLQLGGSFHGYSSRSSHGPTEVILTKLMVMERRLCSSFFEYSHLVWDDVVLSSGEGPLWNGEDIFMSLVANHVYGGEIQQQPMKNNNYAMDWLPVRQAPDSLKDYDHGKLDISGGMKGYRLWDWQWWQSVLRRNRHYSFRGQLWQTAKRRLAELGD